MDYIPSNYYIMSGIECILDKPGNDGSFAHILFSYEYYFLFFYVAFVGSIANLLIFSVHSVLIYIFKYL